MARMQLSQEVRAPASAVFDYVDQHENYEGFFQGFSKFEWTSPRHQAGTRLKLEGKPGGMTVPMELETTAVVPEREISGIFVSGLRGQWEWLFQPLKDSTRITVMIDYDLPAGMTAQAASRALMEKGLLLDLQKTLATLKERVEKRSPTAA